MSSGSLYELLPMIMTSAAQFFAFFAKTKDGRAKDFSRKMTCEKFAKKCPKWSKIDPIFSLKISPFLIQNLLKIAMPI